MWAGGQVAWKQDPTLKNFHFNEGSGRVGRSLSDSFSYSQQGTSGTASMGWVGGQVDGKQDSILKKFHFKEVNGWVGRWQIV